MDGSAVDAVLLDLPFRGRWLARNSPARRVPSHGTDVFGVTYAIDFIAVDGRGRSAPRTWRTFLSVEAPELFRGFGEPILAPAAGTVVSVHDREPDHAARRSQLALLPYALTQAGRVRAGVAAIAGNHVVLALGPGGPFVLLAHLRRGSVRVHPGQSVRSGDQLGECGNSGNSTQLPLFSRSPYPRAAPGRLRQRRGPVWWPVREKQPGDATTRFFAATTLVASNDTISDEFIKLHSNKGGTCFGDSGGPNVLGGTNIALAVNWSTLAPVDRPGTPAGRREQRRTSTAGTSRAAAGVRSFDWCCGR